MKKVVIALAGLLVVMFLLVYLFIPSKKLVLHSVDLTCTESAAQRFILNKNAWKTWWPGNVKNDENVEYQNRQISIDRFTLKGFDISFLNASVNTSAHLQIVYLTDMSSRLTIQSEASFSALPWKRIMQYMEFTKEQETIAALTNDLKKFFNDEQHIYGFTVQKQKVKDSSLVSIKKSFNHYPVTEDVYGLINSLKSYAATKKVKQTGYPMLNVYAVDSTQYNVMAAIPVERDIPSSDNIEQKKMVLGNMLVAEIKGSISTITNAENQMNIYIKDHKYVSPAIGFQSLVSDRQNEKDSTRWITRLCYPVF